MLQSLQLFHNIWTDLTKTMITLIYRDKHSPESCLYRKNFQNSLEKLTTASDFCRVTGFQLLHVRCGCFLRNFLQIFGPAITQNTYEGVLLKKATKIHSYDTQALMYGYITFWMMLRRIGQKTFSRVRPT